MTDKTAPHNHAPRPMALAPRASGMGRRRLLMALAAGAVAPTLTCTAARAARWTIGFSQATTTEPWRILFNQEIRAEAARHPEVELIIRDGQDHIAKQIADVEELIRRRVDALLISPKVADALTPVVGKAYDLGLPVFVLDRDLSQERYTQFVGGDNAEIGREAGRYAVKLLGGAGSAKGNIVEIWGGMRARPAQDRHLGFVQAIAAEPGLPIVNQPCDGDWKQHLAYEIMADALDRFPRIDLVYAHNDPMAYGAFLAAVEAGRAGSIRFLGIDGIPAEGVRWVAQGALTATFLYQTPGAEGLRQALQWLNGVPVRRRIILPTRTIDAGNARTILAENGVAE